MAFVIEQDAVPLVTTADGVVVVTGTRVSLDLIVEAFTTGATAEEIAQHYPTVALADVYAAIAYYLRHRAEVDSYLAQRDRQRVDVRATNERRLDPDGVRDRLLARSKRAEIAAADPLAWEAEGWDTFDGPKRGPLVR